MEITAAEITALLAIDETTRAALVAATAHHSHHHTDGDVHDPANWQHGGDASGATTECPHEAVAVLEFAKQLATDAGETVTGYWVAAEVTRAEILSRWGAVPSPANPTAALSATIALDGRDDLTAAGDTELEIALKLVASAAAL